MSATILNLNPIINLTHEQFYALCVANPDAKLELNANGELVVISPTGGETSMWNAEFNLELGLWNRQSKSGKVFDSSGGFKLPNGSDRSPDGAWILKERWETLTAEQQAKFAPICPDFVVELIDVA